MRPTRVLIPVATIITRAFPLVTVHEENAIFSGVSFSSPPCSPSPSIAGDECPLLLPPLSLLLFSLPVLFAMLPL